MSKPLSGLILVLFAIAAWPAPTSAFDASDAVRFLGEAADAVIDGAETLGRESVNAVGRTAEEILAQDDRTSRRALQQALNDRGFAAGEPDGVFGSKTRRAIRAFQRSIGAQETGVLTHEQALLLLTPENGAGEQQAAGGGAYELLHDFDLPGNDYSMVRDTDIDQCRTLCDQAPDCGAFTFNSHAGACFLKTGAGTPVAFSGAISGRRVASQALAQPVQAADPTESAAAPPVEAAATNLAAMKAFDLPLSGGFVVNPVDEAAQDYTLAVHGDYDQTIVTDRWARFVDQLILQIRPELLQSEETVSRFMNEYFSDEEERSLYAAIDADLADSSILPGFNTLDVFQRRRGTEVFADLYARRYAPLSPSLPLPLVSVVRAHIGEYQFDTERFPITYDPRYGDNRFFGLPRNSARATAEVELTALPQYIRIAASDAEDFWNSLQQTGSGGRVAWLALFGTLTGFDTDLEPVEGSGYGDTDMKSLPGLQFLRARFTSEVSRLALFRHFFADRTSGLTGLIEEYDLDAYLPQVDAATLQARAERRDYDSVQAIEIVSESALVPIVDSYVDDVAFVDEFVMSGNEYRNANEFQRNDVLATERAKMLELRPGAETFWLGGRMTVGRYDPETGHFSISSIAVSTGRNPYDSYLGEVEVTIENLDRFAALAAKPDLAERAVTQDPDRQFDIRIRVRAVAGDFQFQYGDRPQGRLGVEIEEMYVLVDRNGESNPFVLAHVEPGAQASESTTAENGLAPWPERVVLNPDLMGLLAVRAMTEPPSDSMLRQLFADRWMFERQIGTSVPGRFFDNDVAPTGLTFTRRRDEFEAWLKMRVENMPDRYALHWSGTAGTSDDICHRLLLMDRFEPSLDGFMSQNDQQRWYENYYEWVDIGTPRGPVRAEPMVFRTAGPPSSESNYECDPNGREALNRELLTDRDIDRHGVVVVDWLPLFSPSGSAHYDQTRAVIDVALDRIELVANGDSVPHVRLFANYESMTYFSHLDGNIAAAIDERPENVLAAYDMQVFEMSEAAAALAGGQPDPVAGGGTSLDDMILQGASSSPDTEPEIVAEPLSTFGPNDDITAFAVSSSGRLALIGMDNDLSIWNVDTGERVRILLDYGDDVNAIRWFADGRHALSTHYDGTVRVWDLVSGEAVKAYDAKSWHGIQPLADGKRFVMVNQNAQLEMYDIDSGALLRRFEGAYGNDALSISPDGRLVASGSSDKLAVWDLETGELVRMFIGHSSDVTSVAFSPDGNFLITASLDETLKLWDLASGQEVRIFTGLTNTITGVDFTADGRHIVSANYDGKLRVWNVATGRLVRTMVHSTVNIVRGPWLVAENGTVMSTGYEVKVWSMSGLE